MSKTLSLKKSSFFSLKPRFFGKGTGSTETSGDSVNSDENFEEQFEAQLKKLLKRLTSLHMPKLIEEWSETIKELNK